MRVLWALPLVRYRPTHLVSAVLQDIFDMLIPASSQTKGHLTRGLKPCLRESARKREQPQARAVPVLGMAVTGKQPLHQRASGATNALGPVHKALRGPLKVLSVSHRQVLQLCAVPALLRAAYVRGNTGAAVQHLHHFGRYPQLQDLAHQSGRHAVAVALKLHMLIDVNANRFEDRKLPALRRQRLQGRRIKLCKRSRSAAWQLLKRPCVEVLQQGHYGRIRKLPCQVDNSKLEISLTNFLGMNSIGATSPRDSCGLNSL